jgi:signal transduction histidine kinase
VRHLGTVAQRELALFLAVLVVQVGGVAAVATGQDLGPLRWWGALLLAAAAGAVPLRRSRPAAAAWIAKLTTLLYWSLDTPRGPVFIALLITFVNLVYAGRRWHAAAIGVIGIVGFAWLGTVIGDHADPTVVGVTATAGWVGALAGAGEALRSARDRRHINQRNQAETIQRQVAEERIRIARDLHDVVAHNMSLINLRAGVALHLADDADPAVRDALATIKTASKDALVEVRSILGVLRHIDDPHLAVGDDSPSGQPAAESAPRQPTPSLADMAGLVSSASDAGIEVATHVHIDAAVPMPTQVAAYRIVQESLTNVARHAHPPAATLSVVTADDTLRIEVTNATPRPEMPSNANSTRPGNGITGMRERAASVGGTLTAGPPLAGGFTVTARLPLTDRA